VPTAVGALAVRDLGGGCRPLVLWPSLFSDHHLHDRLVPLIHGSWRVVMIDGPGFGDSDPPRPRVRPQDYAAAVIDVLDAQGIDRCVFAGTSWGGQVGAHLAALHPSRVQALLMMNTPLLPSRGGHLFEVVMARLFVDRGFYAKGVARAMLSDGTRRNRPDLVAHFTARFRTFVGRDAAVTAAGVLRAFEGLAEVLPAIAVPTTILMGEADRLYPPETLRPIARTALGATVTVVPGCGHLAPLEAPEAVASALEDLLARAP
jgi:pimeloyl-ACP methyl ester carboxylesterase